MRLSVALVLIAGGALFQTGCTTIHDLGIPSAQFDAIRFDHIEVSAGSQEARLDVVLRFLVDNPTGTQLLVPRHDYAVLLGLDGQPESAMTQIHASSQTRTLVPAHGQTPIEYVIPLSLNPVTANRALTYLGHEAVYQFQATVDLGALNPSTGAPTLKHRAPSSCPCRRRSWSTAPRDSSSWAASSTSISRASGTSCSPPWMPSRASACRTFRF